MPIYAYQCEACGQLDERMLPLSRFDEKQTCSACGKLLRRLFSTVNTKKLTWGRPKYNAGAGRTFANTQEQDAWMKQNGVVLAGKNDSPPRYEFKPKEIPLDTIYNEMNRIEVSHGE